MQHINIKKGVCVLLAACTAIFSASFGAFAVSAETQQGAVGTQEPAITASYTDTDGIAVDGNALTTGNYNMVISVSDLYSIAHLAFSATYNEDILSFNLLDATLLSDTQPYSDEMDGLVLPSLSGEFTFFLSARENRDNVILPNNCADLLTIGITVNSDAPVDMQDVLSVNTHPNLTFIDVDFGDDTDTETGTFYNCYALSDAEDYAGTVYPMTCDLSPELTQYYTVSAYVGALASPDDDYGTYATTGATVTITTDDGTDISAVTGDDGKFVLENVPDGTYTATITYEYGFDRKFTIIVNGANIDSKTMVGIIACDFNQNSDINVSDVSLCAARSGALSGTSDLYDIAFDLTHNGDINITDVSICAAFSGILASTYEYFDTVLES